MTVSRLAQIAFFITVGINLLIGEEISKLIAGVAAIIVGIALMVERG